MDSKHREIMIIAQEECAEVIQEISKIFRFGIDEQHKDGISHRTKLEMELGDLMCMVDLLVEHKIVDAVNVNMAKKIKQDKLKIWSKIYD